MARILGFGNKVRFGGRDISGETRSVEGVNQSRALIESGNINSRYVERIQGLADTSLSFTSYLRDTSDNYFPNPGENTLSSYWIDDNDAFVILSMPESRNITRRGDMSIDVVHTAQQSNVGLWVVSRTSFTSIPVEKSSTAVYLYTSRHPTEVGIAVASPSTTGTMTLLHQTKDADDNATEELYEFQLPVMESDTTLRMTITGAINASGFRMVGFI